MKKHELLKHAYDNYPKGVKFESTNGKEYTSTGNFTCWQEHFNNASHKMSVWRINESGRPEGMVYDGETKDWAEIVNPKIAVKVEKEKDFHALMKHYDGLGWEWNSGDKPLVENEFLPLRVKSKITFENYFSYYINSHKQYKEVSFPDFAKEHNIKLPLIKSEDGVWLYEGDTYFMFDYDKGISGRFDDFRGAGFKATSFPINGYKKQPVIFSDKKSALYWIEAKKPKKIILEFGAYKFTVTKDKVNVCYGDSDTDIDLELINNALKELS